MKFLVKTHGRSGLIHPVYIEADSADIAKADLTDIGLEVDDEDISQIIEGVSDRRNSESIKPTGIKRYKKVPVIVEAIDWVNTPLDILFEFVGDKAGIEVRDDDTAVMIINTKEGDMTADEGDYIIKGVEGEIYPCKPGIFKKTYEALCHEDPK